MPRPPRRKRSYGYRGYTKEREYKYPSLQELGYATAAPTQTRNLPYRGRYVYYRPRGSYSYPTMQELGYGWGREPHTPPTYTPGTPVDYGVTFTAPTQTRSLPYRGRYVYSRPTGGYAQGTLHDPYGETLRTHEDFRSPFGNYVGNKQMKPFMPPAAGYSAYPGEEFATTGGEGGGGYGYGGGGYPTRASTSVSRPYSYVPLPPQQPQIGYRPTVEQRGVQPRQAVITRWLHNLTRWMV